MGAAITTAIATTIGDVVGMTAAEALASTAVMTAASGLAYGAIGAGGGALLGAVTGGDPGQGAMMGGLTGLGGGVGGVLGGGGMLGTGLGAAAGNFAGGMASGQNVGQAGLGALEAGAMAGATAGLTGGGSTPQGASGTGLGAAPTPASASFNTTGIGSDLTMTAPTAASTFGGDIAAAEASGPALMGPSVESSLGIGGSMGAGSTFFSGTGNNGALGQSLSGASVDATTQGIGGGAKIAQAASPTDTGESQVFSQADMNAPAYGAPNPAGGGNSGVQPLDQLVQSAGPSATSALTGAPQLGVPSTGGTSLDQLTGINDAGTSALTGAPASAAAGAQPGMAQRILTSLGVGDQTANSITSFVGDNSKAIGGAGIMGAKLLSSSGTTPQEQQMQNLLAQLGQGTKTNYTAETLPADQQLGDQRNVQAAVQQYKNHMASLGLSGSSQEIAGVQDIYNRWGQVAGAQADALNQQGAAAQPRQASVAAQLAAMQQAQSQQQSDAISQFAQGLFA